MAAAAATKYLPEEVEKFLKVEEKHLVVLVKLQEAQEIVEEKQKGLMELLEVVEMVMVEETLMGLME